jgi:hypothetical protein
VPVRRLTLQQYADLLKDMPAEIEAAVLRGIKSAALRGVGVIVKHIDNAKPYPAVNSGELRNSVGVRFTPRTAVLTVSAMHAVFIDQGTRPHMPPIAPLIVWATRKFGLQPEQAEAVAWAVARKIARDGIEPRHFMAKAMAEIRGEVLPTEVTRELELL